MVACLGLLHDDTLTASTMHKMLYNGAWPKAGVNQLTLQHQPAVIHLSKTLSSEQL